jgi:hypothetical protein
VHSKIYYWIRGQREKKVPNLEFVTDRQRGGRRVERRVCGKKDVWALGGQFVMTQLNRSCFAFSIFLFLEQISLKKEEARRHIFQIGNITTLNKYVWKGWD